MAVSTGIFKTPTGPTYDPSRDIERGFDKTAGIITGFMEKKAQDYDQQQEMFGQVASHIGEIEATLQQNYAGMQQQAIDSTREWLKQNIKKGTRANDPDFQMGLGQRVGAIRAAMGNADKIRQQIDLQIKQLEANPYMDYNGKKAALAELFAMSSNPDILIDKDPVAKMNAVTNKYIDPFLVAKESYNKIPAQGTVQNLFMDGQGNENIREIAITDLTDSANPFDENGQVNLSKLTPERVKEILASDGALANVVEQTRKRNFSSENEDIARVKIVKDLFSTVAATQQTTKISRTADQIKRQQDADKRAEDQYNLSKRVAESQISERDARASKLASTKVELDDLNARLGTFEQAFNEGSGKMFGDYTGKSGILSVEWDSENLPLKKKVPLTLQGWIGLDKTTRRAIVEEAGIPFGALEDTNNKKFFDKVNAKIKELPSTPKGIVIKSKFGQNVTEQVIPINTPDDLKRAFITLEQARNPKGLPSVMDLTEDQGTSGSNDLTGFFQ
jgi:hypothetical protein